MRIAQVAPLSEAVPPRLYGGTERVVSHLTEELVRLGHDVTLFASGDSQTAARLIPGCETALRLDRNVRDQMPHLMLLLEQVRKRAALFDIIHFHVDLFQFPAFRSMANRTVTTLHGRLDLPDLMPFYREFDDMPLVSISDHQRLPMPPVNWIDTVYHGMAPDMLPFVEKPNGDYLAFLGRISPEKRPDRAIEIAKRCGMKLRIFAKVDAADEAYFRERIVGLLDHPLIDFVGEIDDTRKREAIGNARALLFPIDWPEPFGLAMIEAMSCGTPVVAFGRGAVPEVVDDGVTGRIVHTMEEAVAAVNGIGALDRRRVRARFEERFSARRMAEDYLSIYERLLTPMPLEVIAA